MRLVLATTLISALALSGPASAHAFLKTAAPAVGSTVATAPNEVVITFTEGIEPQFTTIAVENASGAAVTNGPVHLAGDQTRAAVGLTKLPPGTYRVVWHATAVDTHKTEGNFTFTVAQ